MTRSPKPWLMRWEWMALGALYLLAAGLRVTLVDADYFSDEPMSYSLSRHGFVTPGGIEEIDGGDWWHYPKSWYLERPGFYLGMTPGALVSFTAYRLEYILATSLLAPLAVQILRARGVRPAFSYPVGLVVAFHPQFLIWGTITHMDSPMAVCLAGGLLAAERGRHRLAAGLFILAVWMKETAMPFLLFLFFVELLREALARRRLPWPLELTPYRSALLAGILLGFIPFLVAQEMWFGLPGEAARGRADQILDELFLSLWLVPLILVGLAWKRSREPAIWALGFPAFYVPLHLYIEWNIREWYLVAPAFLALVSTASTLDEAWSRARRPLAARAVPLAAALAVALLLGSSLAQADSPDKRRLHNPLSELPEPSFHQTLDRERNRNPEPRELLAALEEARPGRAVLVDIHYGLLHHPIPDYVGEIRALNSWELHGKAEMIRAFVDAAETYGDLTIVQKHSMPSNEAIRRAYADCVTRDAAYFVFLDVRACPGRFDRLFAELATPGRTP